MGVASPQLPTLRSELHPGNGTRDASGRTDCSEMAPRDAVPRIAPRFRWNFCKISARFHTDLLTRGGTDA